MTTALRHPCEQTYALRLRATEADPAAVVGQLEHVLSGECLGFESAAALLESLARLQARVVVTPDRSRAGAG